MRLITTLLGGGLALSLLIGGCDKKETGPTNTEAKPKAAEAAAPATPDVMPAADFFKDFSSLKGMEVMKKYGKGVSVSGTVLKTITEMNKSTTVWLDSGAGTWVSLKFKDNGAAFVAKEGKKGDAVEASCKVGGGTDKFIGLTGCTLK